MNLLIFIIMALSSKTSLSISSTAFKNNGDIPSVYTCEGKNINPPLSISDIPKEAKTLALIVDDPDAPSGTFDHWLIWNINPSSDIKENSQPGIEGKNGAGKNGYIGPCPPSGKHRYFFKVFALDTKLEIASGMDKKNLQRAMEGHILAQGELIGLYQKQK